MWNEISLVQDLNSCRRVHFLRRYTTGTSVILCSRVCNHLYRYLLRTLPNVTISWHGTTVTLSQLRIPTSIPAPNITPFCTTTFVVSNIIIMIDLILEMAPNVIPCCLFINPFFAPAVFEKTTENEWHNPSGSSSDSRDGKKLPGCLVTERQEESFVIN